MSKAERAHLERVASLPCACCGDTPVQVHHIREGQGMAQRASDWLTVPLCPACHTGPKGIHGDQTMMRVFKLTELDMLADTIKKLTGADNGNT